jgi:hypothetical protein
VSQTSRSGFELLRLTLRAQPRSPAREDARASPIAAWVDRAGGVKYNRTMTSGLCRNLSSHIRSMKIVFPILLSLVLAGCSPASSTPPSRAAHVKQVQQLIVKAGGESEILKESRILFPRCSAKKWSMPGVGPEDGCFAGLSGIQSLGDVFYYELGRVRIRIHNSHQDTYFIYLLDPEQPQPANFERIAGNVGFIEP